MAVKIAQNLDDIDITLDNKALNEENYEDYYVETKEGRGEDPTSIIIRKLKNLEDRNFKILFSGFKGCGKSTELLRLKRELENEFLIKIFSVREKLDPNNLSISEILIAVMIDLFNFVRENHSTIKLSQKLLKNLKKWTSTIYTEEIKYKYHEIEAGAGVDLRSGFGKILGVIGKLGFEIKSGRKYSEITGKEENQTLSELILNCNLLIAEIKNQLHKINKKNIIFIIEDMEKVDLTIAENIFHNYSKQLTSISCCFIYTFPISLVFNPKYNIILNEFDENFVLPMIKVHDKKDKNYAPGISSIKKILYKRINKKLLNEDLMTRFILLSGGCLRDLFRMTKLAAGSAINRGKEKIEEVDFDYGLNKLKSDYYNTISYNKESGLSANEYYKILRDCCENEKKKPMDVNGMMDLKHNMCILGYNGDVWFDVHPVVKIILKEMEPYIK
ncbi:MAG: hypothetical protein KAW12_30775 [Candidatus Aminicenantes bacterium]|nr:hypothetical protein [Candidatus Aminicenantes bacterium]